MQAPEHIELRMIRGQRGVREVSSPYSVLWRGSIWTVPRGFKTDGSSIPALLWPWLGAKFDYANAQAGALHDAAYEGKLFKDGKPEWMPPMLAHAMWREVRTCLLQAEAGPIMRRRFWIQGWLCWFALVAFYVVWGKRMYVPFTTWRERHSKHER
jgi:hypothetical protein